MEDLSTRALERRSGRAVPIRVRGVEPDGAEPRLRAAWAAAGIEASVAVERGRRAAGLLRMIWRLWRSVRRDPPDLLFGAGRTSAVAMVAMKLLLGRRCPPVVLKIGDDLDRADRGAVMKRLSRRWCRLQGRWLDHFVALAEPMRDQIASAMAVGAERISVIPDPALSVGDLKLFAAAGDKARASRADGRRFIAVGRLVRQTNFGLLLEAFASGRVP